MASSKSKDERTQPRTGSVAPEDAELTTWLHALWHGDEPPQRLEVFQLFNPRHSVRGQMIHHIDFKANSKYDVEEANKLANQLIAAAQHDCDCAEQKSFYEIAIVDHNRRAMPLVRRLGPLYPKVQYVANPKAAADSGGNGGDSEDEDDIPGPRTISERYNVRLLRHLEQKESQLNRVVGDLLVFQRDALAEQRQWNATMASNHMKFFVELQDALDRRKERDIAGAWTEMKVNAARDGMRVGRNVLLGMFGQAAAEQKQIVAASPIAAAAHAVTQKIGRSVERSLIDGFLTDCEEAGILSQLCGEWNDQGPIAGKEGIFTPQQVAILVKVRDGELPADAVDNIIPGMGGAYEITLEQVMKAQPVVPDSIAQAIFELQALRQTKRAQATQTAASAAAK